MWLFAMFDLPVTTKPERQRATRFRLDLQKEGFSRLQYSVYAVYCPSEEAAAAYRNRVAQCVPPDGQVRIVGITDHQFGKMQVYEGASRVDPEPPPQQVLLF